jgi:DNA (cytosine-5)-methyltransferase 1
MDSNALSYGSVCSGIESASVAWEPLGWRPAWFAEIEPFPSSVLAHHYPHVANLGDMTKIAARVRAGEIEAPEILVGGTPCQAFSVAGARAGLADPRGQLTLAYVDLANAIDSTRAVRGQQPVITVWENVPGVLSSRDNAFGCFLGALAGESCELKPPGGKWKDAGCVFGPARAVAWRVLDAQYFGLAQRRRRVFVVASARSGFNPAAVLFESEGLRRDTPPSRSERENYPATAVRSVALRGRVGGATAELGDDLAGCLRASSGVGDKAHVMVPIAFAQNSRNEVREMPYVGALSAEPGSKQTSYIRTGMAVRRVTPVECERLQGFQDGYTSIRPGTADGPRYKVIGNSKAVPVGRWIGRRIQSALLQPSLGMLLDEQQ